MIKVAVNKVGGVLIFDLPGMLFDIKLRRDGFGHWKSEEKFTNYYNKTYDFVYSTDMNLNNKLIQQALQTLKSDIDKVLNELIIKDIIE